MSLRLATERQRSTAPQGATTSCSSLLEAVTTEVSYRPLTRSLYTGKCPTCPDGVALAWGWRHSQPRDSWRCLDCDTRGSLYNLSRRFRERQRLTNLERRVAA